MCLNMRLPLNELNAEQKQSRRLIDSPDTDFWSGERSSMRQITGAQPAKTFLAAALKLGESLLCRAVANDSREHHMMQPFLSFCRCCISYLSKASVRH